MRSTLLAIMAFALLLSSAGRAQDVRPSIPERACTRVSLVVVPGTGAHAREVGLRVVNNDPADFSAQLVPEVTVQQLVGGTWTPVSVAGLLLRETCDPVVGRTVTIPRDTSLEMVPWTGMLGDAQCDCTRCGPAPAGTYRFVVQSGPSCFMPRTFESAPFTLPAP